MNRFEKDFRKLLAQDQRAETRIFRGEIIVLVIFAIIVLAHFLPKS